MMPSIQRVVATRFFLAIVLCHALSCLSAQSNELHPYWSPEGDAFVFVSDKNGAGQLYIYQFESGESKAITQSELDAGNPAWSPLGDLIAFHAKPEDHYNIYTIQSDGQGLRQLTQQSYPEMSPGWSKDGDYIYFDAHVNGLWQIDRIGSGGGLTETFLRGGGDYLAAFGGWDDQIYVSFSREVGNHQSGLDLVRTDSKGGILEQVTQDSGGSSNASLSKSMKWMALNTLEDGDWEIVIVHLTTGARVKITENEAIDGQPSLSPDGSKVLFTSNVDGDFDVYMYGIGSGKLENLTDDF